MTPTYFYPRPPRGGRRTATPAEEARNIFLSTPSARRATRSRRSSCRPYSISIHALREEGDDQGAHQRPDRGISIHALREEGDLACKGGKPMKNQFLSTPSARRATQLHALGAEVVVISIHALREEGDSKNSSPSPGTANFYPRPPRGGRRTASRCFRSLQYFYPRPPRGGRPAISVPPYTSTVFLSTPSARRATALPVELCTQNENFYPRPPRGGRPAVVW